VSDVAEIEELREQRCVACRRDSPRVTEEEAAALQPLIPEWAMEEHDGVPRLVRTFKLPNFREALAFTQRVGELAEEEGHHPAILTEWGKVTVSWWTHKIKGLHKNDFIMAAKTDALAAETAGVAHRQRRAPVSRGSAGPQRPCHAERSESISAPLGTRSPKPRFLACGLGMTRIGVPTLSNSGLARPSRRDRRVDRLLCRLSEGDDGV
jgi:4a-hydroxytetrahydrobiopterin dehydratase